mgnify:CR=1 FL=1
MQVANELENQQIFFGFVRILLVPLDMFADVVHFLQELQGQNFREAVVVLFPDVLVERKETLSRLSGWVFLYFFPLIAKIGKHFDAENLCVFELF